MERLERPDALVLGVGGVLGEAWMSGFLAGAAEAAGIDFRRADCFVGTSAGSIVAARLAAGMTPESSIQAPSGESAPAGAAGAVRDRAGRIGVASVPALALSAASPAGALVRAALLSRIPRGRIALDGLRARIAQSGARFDGRLRVVAVDMRSGRRVVFGGQGAPPAEVADAVCASCAVPSLFRPVRIGVRDYVDGGVWSPTNLDVARLEAGARVLCLVPTAVLQAAPSALFRNLSRGWRMATALEAAAARGRGVQVTIVEPDERAASAMGGNLMDARPRKRVQAAGFAQGLDRGDALVA